MNLLVFGAGVLGSLYAARLQDAGHQVTLLARGQRLADLRAQGIVLEDGNTGHQTRTQVAVVEALAPADGYDLVIVLVRKDQVASVLPALAANRQTPAVLFMVNNAAGPAAFVDALGQDRVLLGFPGAGGTRQGAVVRYRVLSRWIQPTTLGEVDGRMTVRLRQIADTFRQAGFPVALSARMDAWLKTHVALVSPIASALYMADGDPYRLARSRQVVALMVRALRESQRVLQALHIPITPAYFSVLDWLPPALLVPLWQMSLNTRWAELVIAQHANVARMEMRLLAEEFRSLCVASGVATPALDQLTPDAQGVCTPL
jgi:2-dehydropantoate 2-reductase